MLTLDHLHFSYCQFLAPRAVEPFSDKDQGLLLRLRDNGNEGNNNYAGDGEWF